MNCNFKCSDGKVFAPILYHCFFRLNIFADKGFQYCKTYNTQRLYKAKKMMTHYDNAHQIYLCIVTPY